MEQAHASCDLDWPITPGTWPNMAPTGGSVMPGVHGVLSSRVSCRNAVIARLARLNNIS
jgi:hypothetical protein